MIRLEFDRRRFALGLGACLVLGTAMHLASENVTLTTSYPSPSGIYQRITSTNQTILARDAGSVGIRTATPGATLDVNGTVLARGGLTAAAGLTNNGSRTGLQGLDAGNGWHWLMSGGMTEGVHNALGFRPSQRIIAPGPGWTLTGGGVQASQGVFGINCGANNCPGGVMRTFCAYVPFTPVGATCSPMTDGYTNSWYALQCPNYWIVLGPNYACFTARLSYGGHTYNPGGALNYMIVGR